MRYPRQQAEVVSLVDQMIGGITEHADKFPSCDAAILQVDRDEYEQISAALTDAQAQVAIIAAQKLDIFKKMEKDIKCQIKLGVVDTVDNPVELGLIGWGTKRAPQQIEIPGSPLDLKITAQGDGMVCLVWRKSRYSGDKSKNGGPIRCYTIECRQCNDSNPYGDWMLAATALNNEYKLTKQPIGCKLEYRVKAINSSGESIPGNTVGVVL